VDSALVSNKDSATSTPHVSLDRSNTLSSQDECKRIGLDDFELLHVIGQVLLLHAKPCCVLLSSHVETCCSLHSSHLETCHVFSSLDCSQGGFGKVYQARHKQSGDILAMKSMRKDTTLQ
jgi:hypothetical protein